MSLSDRAASKDNFLLGENSKSLCRPISPPDKTLPWKASEFGDPKGSADSSDDEDRGYESQNPSLKRNQKSVLQKTIKAITPNLKRSMKEGSRMVKPRQRKKWKNKSRELSSLLELLKSGQCDVTEYYHL